MMLRSRAPRLARVLISEFTLPLFRSVFGFLLPLQNVKQAVAHANCPMILKVLAGFVDAYNSYLGR